MSNERPFIKHVDPQIFLTVQFMHIMRGEIICPNCGLVSKLGIMDFDKLSSYEEKEKFAINIQFKFYLGLCSDECSKEFLGGIYDVFKQR